MSSTLTVIRQRAMYELGVGYVIPNADISAITASTFTAARWGQNSTLGGGDLQAVNAGFFRGGSATAADNYRPAGSVVVATGVYNQVGPTWADTTIGSEDIEVPFYGVRWDDGPLKSLNRVTQNRYTTTMLAVSHLSRLDGDVALSTTTNFTAISSATLSKVTTEALVPWGPRALRIVNTVANGGARSASMRVRAGSLVNAFTVVLSEIGTSSLQPYDATNSAVFGTAVTSGERRAQLLTVLNATVPSTSKLWSVNLTNTSASGDSDFDQVWAYSLDDPICPLPASLTESFQAPRIYQAVPNTSTGTNTYDGEDFDLRPLVAGIDYWFVINHNDAQPYKVRFANPLPSTGGHPFDNPIMVEARVPMSSQVTLSAESDSLNGAINEIMPAFKIDLLETVYNVGPRRLPDWEVQYNRAKANLVSATQARPIEPVGLIRPAYSGVHRL